jgi:hypothetical protein
MRSFGPVGTVVYDAFTAENPTTPATLPYGPQAFATTSDKQLGGEWTEQLGNFVVNGALVNNAQLALATLNGVSAGGLTVKAQVDLAFGSGNSVGLLGRYNGVGEGMGYLADLYADPKQPSSVTARIFRRDLNGSLSLLRSATTADNSGILEFDLSGSTLTLKMDGTTLVTATDTTYATGSAGVRLFGATGTVSIHNFNVTTP